VPLICLLYWINGSKFQANFQKETERQYIYVSPFPILSPENKHVASPSENEDT